MKAGRFQPFALILFLCLFSSLLLAEPRQEKWMEEKETRILEAGKYAAQLVRAEQEERRPAKKPEKAWTIFGGFGYEYDDNVPLAADKKQYRTAGIDMNAGRYSGQMGGSYDFLRRPNQKAGLAYTYDSNLHDDSLEEFNFQNHSLSAYGRQLFEINQKPATADLSYQFAHGLLDKETFSSSHFWNLSFATEWQSNWILTTYERLGTYNFRDKGFDAPLSSRDGFYSQTGFLQKFFFDERKRSLALGYEFELAETEGDNFDQINNGVRCIFKTPLVEKVDFESSFYFKVAYYHNFATEPKRLDLHYHYEFKLSRPIGKIWKTSVFYRRTDVNNTHDGVLGHFNYNRNILGFSFSFRY